MPKESSLISVVIPCYNDDVYIKDAVFSILNQTYQNIEIIVVDDGSNNKTKRVLKTLEPKIYKLITQTNKGQSKARNIGINASNGNYIVVLDSDDYFEPSFCKKALTIIKQDKNIKLVTCYANLIFESKKPQSIYKPKGGEIKNFLITNCAIGNAMFKKEDWMAVGQYDESMTKGFEDWEFYIRLLKSGGIAYTIKESLFNYRKRKNTTTSIANKIKYDLRKFIVLKHQDLYKKYFEHFIDHLFSEIENHEIEKKKHLQGIEFKIGKMVLKPIRWLKHVIKL